VWVKSPVYTSNLTIRVVDEARRGLPPLYRPLQHVDYELGSEVVRHPPAHRPPGGMSRIKAR
jgi:hypothetical protein